MSQIAKYVHFRACYTMQYPIQYRLLHLKRFIHSTLHCKLPLLQDKSWESNVWNDFAFNPRKMNKNKTLLTSKVLMSLSCPVRKPLILTHSFWCLMCLLLVWVLIGSLDCLYLFVIGQRNSLVYSFRFWAPIWKLLHTFNLTRRWFPQNIWAIIMAKIK